jgi:hypothetical protein
MERGLISNTTSRIQLFWSDILSSTSAKILVFRQFLQLFWYLRSVFANLFCVLYNFEKIFV